MNAKSTKSRTKATSAKAATKSTKAPAKAAKKASAKSKPAKASKKVAQKAKVKAKPATKVKAEKASTPKPSKPAAKTKSKAQPKVTSKASAKQTTRPHDKADPPRAPYQDFDAMTEFLTDVSGKSQDVVAEFFQNRLTASGTVSDEALDPLNVRESFQEMMKGLSADPSAVMQRQFLLWGEQAKVMARMTQRINGETVRPAAVPDRGDKRFTHPAWEDNPFLDFIKQSYLVSSRWLENTVASLEDIDEHDKAKAQFYTKQFIDACAPPNFPIFNPEVIETTLESGGENLLRGLDNFLGDMERGHGSLAIRQADLDHFKLGENIATTPGSVVFQNDIMQLIQYAPTTEKAAKTPLLILPPWINKFYILDLQPQNSFIKWAIDQGRTVFVVSWVNPEPKLKGKTFEDYIHGGLFEALSAVEQATGEKQVDTIGYCIGGTMLSTALSLMAKTGDTRVKTATFFTAQADFEEAGDLLLFVDDEQLDSIEKQMDAAGGVLEGRAMATTFNMLRSNDLIWSFVIDNYLMGKEPAKFDLLFWNSDATRMPKNVHLYYLREFYQHNRLAKGNLKIDGHALDLGDVDIPIFMQAGETDHIAPHNSVYRTAKLYGSKANKEVTYMLAGSGHIAGVINHPDKKKYHHSINPKLPASLDEWKDKATKYDGSWWPYWIKWLNKKSGGEVPARHPGDGKLKIIEAAPGSYVKVKA